MPSKNPSALLAESLADFSKAAHQVFAEVENQTRQEVAFAVAEAREARAERDKAMKDLRALQLESQSWKEAVASSKAALTQAELAIANQAENLVSQLETITQLRRELNQWKDQARNWQEHFLRVEEERCAQSSRIDEFIMQKLEKFQYSTRPGTSANALVIPKTPRQMPQINSAPSSVTTKRPASPRHTQPPAYKANASSATPEDARLNGAITHAMNTATAANISRPHHTPDSGSRRPKPKSQISQHHQLKEMAAALPETSKSTPSGKKPRKSNDNNHNTGTTSAQSHPQQQLSSTQSNVRTSTVIRHVHAVINVKREEDDIEDSGGVAISSAPSAPDANFVKHGNEGNSRRRLVNRRETAVMSDDEEWGEEESRGNEASTYKLRKTSRINYHEEDDIDGEDDELMMGAEENHDTVALDQSKQQAGAVAHPRKKRKYSLR